MTEYDFIITLISKQKPFSILYIAIQKFCKKTIFWENCVILKVFLHSTDLSYTLTSGLFALINFEGSAMFITENTLAGQNTTIQQVLL